MKNETIAVLLLAAISLVFLPTTFASDNATYISVEAYSDNDIDARFWMESGGDTQVWIDNVPYREPIKRLRGQVFSQQRRVRNVSSRVSNLSEWFLEYSQSTENFKENVMIRFEVHDNRLNLVLRNTRYNKKQMESFIENVFYPHNEDYQSYKEETDKEMEKLDERVRKLENQRNYALIGSFVAILVLALLFTRVELKRPE